MRQTQVSLLGTILGAGFWGLSGTAAQALFQIYQFPVVALVTIRTLASGVILLIIVRPARPGRRFGPLLGLSILGFAGSQLAYLWAIQFSNAATATLLQFLFLPIVAGYEAVKGCCTGPFDGLFHCSWQWWAHCSWSEDCLARIFGSW